MGLSPPHERQHRYPFYYPNKQNRFWPMLAKIAGLELNATSVMEMVEERKRILEHLKVGVHNVAKTIRRTGKSSLDQDIEILEFHDLFKIIDEYPTLHTIIITGFSSKSGAAPAFKSYLEQAGINVDRLPRNFRAGDHFILNHQNRKIKCVVVNSTSPAAFQISFDMLEKQFGSLLV